jgi:hypothetical protein
MINISLTLNKETDQTAMKYPPLEGVCIQLD